MRGTELGGELEPALGDVDGHDGLAAHDARRHDRAQSDRTGARDRERTSVGRTEDVDHGAGTCLDATPQRREQLQRCVAGDLDRCALMNERMRRERRLTDEVTVDLLTAPTVGRGLVRSRAGEVHRRRLHAVDGVTGAARDAGAAEGEGQDDAVARADARDTRPDRLHDAAAFVAEHDRQGQREVAATDSKVGVTDARGNQAYQDLVDTGIFELQRLDGEGVLAFAQDGGVDLHGSPRWSGRARVGWVQAEQD